MITKLIKVDGGLAITIPDSMLAQAGLSVGSEVIITASNKRITIEAADKVEAIKMIMKLRGKKISDAELQELKVKGREKWDSFFNSDSSVSDDFFKDRE